MTFKMTFNKGMLTSMRHDWETPKEFVNIVKKSFITRFDLDACATDKTAKADKYFTKECNAFSQEWRGIVWLNPPYGKELPLWLDKAYTESRKEYCRAVYCLVPARPDTKWFHTIAVKGQIFLIQGRIKFLQNGKPVGSPAFPSMLVIFDKNAKPRIATWSPEKI